MSDNIPYRAMMHDEKLYGSDALKFRPERIFESDPRLYKDGCGYSRRICPGQYRTDFFCLSLAPELMISILALAQCMAQDVMWLAVASILAVYDISKALDENGNDVEPPDDHYRPGFVA